MKMVAGSYATFLMVRTGKPFHRASTDINYWLHSWPHIKNDTWEQKIVRDANDTWEQKIVKDAI